jgi:hypothetical protein
MRVRSGFAITLILLGSLQVPAHAQIDIADAIVRCDGKFGLCRYIDRKTQQELIPARFERAMPFHEGLAPVRINGQFGYIDARGDVVIAPAFDFAGQFQDGLAEIRVGDKTGVIDRSGKIVVPPMFRRAIPWTKDVIIAIEGTWRYEFYPELPLLSHGLLSLYRVSAGLYHVDGYWIRKPDLDRVSSFEPDGRGPIIAADRTGLSGLLRADGKWLVEPQYDSIFPLVDGRATVRKRVNGEDLSGVVGPNGEVIVPLQAQQVPLLAYRRDGWTRARERGSDREGFVDERGNLIGGRYFDEVRRPLQENGATASVRIEGLWKGLDRAGNIVPHPDNGRVMASCPNGVRVVAQDGRVQITDADGRATVPYLLDLISEPDCVKPFSVKHGDKWGFVATDGRPLFDPPVFDHIHAFEGGYAVVRQNGKWGIIDSVGRFVQPVKFDAYKGKREGVFQFVIDGREIWITALGEERTIPPRKYTPVPDVLNCGHGLRLFERDGKWGIADENGRDVIAPQYRALSCFLSGVAWAAIDARREWCALGPDGVVRAAPKCRTDVYLLGASHSIPEKFDEDRFENSVLWSRAYLEFHAGKRDIPPGWTSDRGMDGPVWR